MVRTQRSCRQALASSVSFVDRMSFAVIERDSLGAALATDADFRAAGVRVVPPATEPTT
jgi:predicted nucleic acid-binding protein